MDLFICIDCIKLCIGMINIKLKSVFIFEKKESEKGVYR